MNKTLNCWEHKRCGREPGGSRTSELGVCIAASERRTDGVNRGRNGGRACWAIAGTLCGGTVQGTFAEKLASCLGCDFYALVRREETSAFVPSNAILERLKGPGPDR